MNQSSQPQEIPQYKLPIWHGRQHKYCVVIPVLNEGERIIQLLNRMHKLNTQSLADIIIVDGGSTDNSLDPYLLETFNIRALLVKIGKGQLGSQLRCAYAFALEHGYEGVITIDGNNKDDPESIPSFINVLQNGVDFAQGSRFLKYGSNINTPLLRILAIKIIHAPLLSLTSGFRWTDSTQGFRGYSKKLLQDEKLSIFRNVFTSYELLSYISFRAPQLGLRCIEIPTIRAYPKGEVPTKITMLRGNFNLFFILIKTCLRFYNLDSKCNNK